LRFVAEAQRRRFVGWNYEICGGMVRRVTSRAYLQRTTKEAINHDVDTYTYVAVQRVELEKGGVRIVSSRVTFIVFLVLSFYGPEAQSKLISKNFFKKKVQRNIAIIVISLLQTAKTF
jgi:hypothetical protein